AISSISRLASFDIFVSLESDIRAFFRMAKGYKGSKGPKYMEHNTKTALGFGIPLAGVLAIIAVVSLANGTMFTTQVKPAPTAVVPATTQESYGDCGVLLTGKLKALVDLLCL